MRKLTLMLGMLFACVALVAQTTCNLLPMPQQVNETSGFFSVGKTMLVTPVLQDEWKAFIAEAGGEIVEKSSRKIEVKLVPEVQGAKINQEEALKNYS